MLYIVTEYAQNGEMFGKFKILLLIFGIRDFLHIRAHFECTFAHIYYILFIVFV